MKTTVIIDDEADARHLLREYITLSGKMKIIGEAADGHSAVQVINSLKPDVIFLDIQMPGLNGFEVLPLLNYIPDVIFATAYDQYAIKAFEVHALDYLLKPYSKKRFENTLDRIVNNQNGLTTLTEALLNKQNKFPQRVLLHKGNRRVMKNIDELYFAEAFGDYTKVYTHDQEYLSIKGISTLLDMLDPNTFIRVHRSHIVNINHIIEVKKTGRYFFVILNNKTSLKVSQTYLPMVRKYMI